MLRAIFMRKIKCDFLCREISGHLTAEEASAFLFNALFVGSCVMCL
jgi:hypothetical protein